MADGSQIYPPQTRWFVLNTIIPILGHSFFFFPQNLPIQKSAAELLWSITHDPDLAADIPILHPSTISPRVSSIFSTPHDSTRHTIQHLHTYIQLITPQLPSNQPLRPHHPTDLHSQIIARPRPSSAATTNPPHQKLTGNSSSPSFISWTQEQIPLTCSA